MNQQELDAMHNAIDSHYENFDIAKMKEGGDLYFTAEQVQAAPAEVIPKICGLYQAIRPFVDWASRFFLIPKKIKTVLKGFMELMDKVCPAS